MPCFDSVVEEVFFALLVPIQPHEVEDLLKFEVRDGMSVIGTDVNDQFRHIDRFVHFYHDLADASGRVASIPLIPYAVPVINNSYGQRDLSDTSL